MTRVIALMFAAVLCYSILIMARRDHLHDAGWPFCALAIATLLAVPLQAMFKALIGWFQSKPGKALVDNLISKVSPVPLGVGSASSAVTTTTTVEPGA